MGCGPGMRLDGWMRRASGGPDDWSGPAAERVGGHRDYGLSCQDWWRILTCGPLRASAGPSSFAWSLFIRRNFDNHALIWTISSGGSRARALSHPRSPRVPIKQPSRPPHDALSRHRDSFSRFPSHFRSATTSRPGPGAPPRSRGPRDPFGDGPAVRSRRGCG